MTRGGDIRAEASDEVADKRGRAWGEPVERPSSGGFSALSEEPRNSGFSSFATAGDERVAPPPRQAPAEAYRVDAPPDSARGPGDPFSGGRFGPEEPADPPSDAGAERRRPRRSAKPVARSRVIFALCLMLAAYLALAFGQAAARSVEISDLYVLLVAPVAFGLFILASMVRWDPAIYILLAASFAAQTLWAQWIDPRPFGEFEQLWRETALFGQSLAAASPDFDTLYRSASPSTVAIYGVVAAASGESFEAVRIFSALLWTVQTLMVWRIAREVSELRDYAFAAALIFGVSPTLLVFGGLPSVEAVFGVFATTAIYLILSHRKRGLVPSAAQSGALAGAAFLARPTALAFALGLIVILLFALVRSRAWKPRAKMLVALFAATIGFCVGVAPQATLNLSEGDEISIAPGPAIGYGLIVGTNRVDEDGYSPEDMRAAGFIGDPPTPLREADLRARAIAWERIATDPLGFLGFAFTEKMTRLWSSEREMLQWSAEGPTGAAERYRDSGLANWAPRLVDGVYITVLVAAMIGAIRLVMRGGAVRDPTRWVLLTVSFLTLASAHLVFEVREPHHLTFAPFLALLAPLSFARLPVTEAAAARALERARAQAEIEEASRRQAALAEARAERAATAEAQTVAAEIGGGPEMPTPKSDIVDRPPEERLAYVLSRMSKPPRPQRADAPASKPSEEAPDAAPEAPERKDDDGAA